MQKLDVNYNVSLAEAANVGRTYWNYLLFLGLWNALNMDLNNNEITACIVLLLCRRVKYFKQSNFTDTVLTILVIVFK